MKASFLSTICLLLSISCITTFVSGDICTGVYCGTQTCSESTGQCVCNQPMLGTQCTLTPNYSSCNTPFGNSNGEVSYTGIFSNSNYQSVASVDCPPGTDALVRFVNARSLNGNTFRTRIGLSSMGPSLCNIVQLARHGNTGLYANSVDFKCESGSSCEIKYAVALECRAAANINRTSCAFSNLYCSGPDYYGSNNMVGNYVAPACCPDGRRPEYDFQNGICRCGVKCPNGCIHGKCTWNGTCECLPTFTGSDCSIPVSSASSSSSTASNVVASSSSVGNTNLENCVCRCCNTASCSASVVGSFHATTSGLCSMDACRQTFPAVCPASGSNGVVSVLYSDSSNNNNNNGNNNHSAASRLCLPSLYLFICIVFVLYL